MDKKACKIFRDTGLVSDGVVGPLAYSKIDECLANNRKHYAVAITIDDKCN